MNEHSEYEDEYTTEIESTKPEEKEALQKSDKQPDTAEKTLQDISDTLHLLKEQIAVLSENINSLPPQTRAINAAADNLHSVAGDLSRQIHNDCLAEYKKIIENAARNYSQLQKSADRWQKSLSDERESTLKLIKISAMITPLLLLILIIFMVF